MTDLSPLAKFLDMGYLNISGMNRIVTHNDYVTVQSLALQNRIGFYIAEIIVLVKNDARFFRFARDFVEGYEERFIFADIINAVRPQIQIRGVPAGLPGRKRKYAGLQFDGGRHHGVTGHIGCS